MAELTDRLRNDRPVYTLRNLRLREEAAKEIERLRMALEIIAERASMPIGGSVDFLIEVAEAALENRPIKEDPPHV